jgi:uridine kinase
VDDRLVKQPKIIGVAGLSGSGKSTLSKMLGAELNCQVLCQDDFYLGVKKMKTLELNHKDFDDLRSIDIEALHCILDNAKPSNSIHIPDYCFKTSEPIGHKKITLSDPLIVDGHMMFCDEKIRSKIDFMVFIDVSINTAKNRRFKRDVVDRGFTVDSCNQYYEMNVKPRIKEVLKLRNTADYLYENDDVNSFEKLTNILRQKI